MKHIFLLGLALLLLAACKTQKAADKLHLKNQNVIYGKVIAADSQKVTMQRKDLSLENYAWEQVDSVAGVAYPSPFVVATIGIYKSPYFSVLRNAPLSPTALGFGLKLGWAKYQKRLFYFDWEYLPASPYRVTKWGVGFQRYFWQSYLAKNALFWGGDFHLMFAKYNNGPQVSLLPFVGFERAITPRIRANASFHLQLNPLNKNNQLGTGLNVGAMYLFKDVHKKYRNLNQHHHLSKS